MKFSVLKKGGRKHHVLQHILFWLISLVLFTVVLFFLRGDFNLASIDFRIASSILVTIFFLAISVYINLLWLIPSFFNRRKFWQFSLLELGNIVLFILLNFYVSYFFEGGQHPNILAEVVAEFILVLIFLIISTLLKVMRDSITLQDVELRMKEMEKQKVEAELKALKMQVNPHFFFNTLNSLYSLSLDKSDKAPELILKLSDLMRYVIYESKDDLVAIEKQLEFLQSYVYLERLRSPEYLKVNFNVEGENLDLRVAPLLFIAFIENAFKHGSKDRSMDPFIDIRLDLTRRDRIFLSVKNTVDPGYKSKTMGGVGLANVKKQLELIYAGKYTLDIAETPNGYNVELTIFVS
jgi:sensor histidine kinase YesM